MADGRDARGRFTRGNVVGGSQIRTALGRFASAMHVAVYEAAAEEAKAMQEEMRSAAKWTDRTGQSRQNLFAEVHLADPTKPGAPGAARQQFEYKSNLETVSGAGGVTIYLYGTTRGNFFLEILTFPYKGYLGIIRPTAQKHGPALLRRLQAKARGVGL